jgi:hypothetical protein
MNDCEFKIKKLYSIENGIIELLNKKYKIDTYSENTYKYKSIDLDHLKLNINTTLNNYNDILNKYLEIDSILCLYDIDIFNMILKFISINKTLEDNDFGLKYSFMDTINYYFGYEIENKQYKISYQHFDKKSLTINKLIKSTYLHITNNIIIPNSY